MSDKKHRVKLEKAVQGYIVTSVDNFNYDRDPEVYLTFTEAVKAVAEGMEEPEFAATLEHAQGIAQSFSALTQAVLAPQFLAIEAKVNPGVESVVDEDDIVV